MNASHYNVVFAGKTQPGVALDAVKANLSKAFNANAAQLARLFSGQSVVVGKNLSEQQARRYETAIVQSGGVCRLIALTDPSALPQSAPLPGTTEPVVTIADDSQQAMTEQAAQQPDQGIDQDSDKEDQQRPAPATPRRAFTLIPRINRIHFVALAWLAVSVAVAAWLVPTYLPSLLGIRFTLQVDLMLRLGLHGLAGLVMLYLMAMRLHDLNKSGALAMGLFIPLVNVVLMGLLTLAPGSSHANRYGPPPAAAGTVAYLLGLYVPLLLIIAAAIAVYLQPAASQLYLQQYIVQPIAALIKHW